MLTDKGLAEGQVVGGDYRIDRLVADTEFATTYLGTRLDGGAQVFVRTFDLAKFLPAASLPMIRRRFVNEARQIAEVAHANLEAVLSAGEERGLLYLVTEHMGNDTSLARILSSARPTAEGATHFMLQILAGLSEAHRHGHPHRDLTPARVHVRSDGSLKIADFALVKLFHTLRGTREGFSLVHAYSSPEVVRGDELSAASDLYAAGAIAYELYVGMPPYSGGDAELRKAILEKPVAIPSDVAQRLPERLRRFLEVAMAKEPGSRHPNADEMALELSYVRAALRQAATTATIITKLPPKDRVVAPLAPATPPPSPAAPPTAAPAPPPVIAIARTEREVPPAPLAPPPTIPLPELSIVPEAPAPPRAAPPADAAPKDPWKHLGRAPVPRAITAAPVAEPPRVEIAPIAMPRSEPALAAPPPAPVAPPSSSHAAVAPWQRAPSAAAPPKETKREAPADTAPAPRLTKLPPKGMDLEEPLVSVKEQGPSPLVILGVAAVLAIVVGYFLVGYINRKSEEVYVPPPVPESVQRTPQPPHKRTPTPKAETTPEAGLSPAPTEPPTEPPTVMPSAETPPPETPETPATPPPPSALEGIDLKKLTKEEKDKLLDLLVDQVKMHVANKNAEAARRAMEDLDKVAPNDARFYELETQVLSLAIALPKMPEEGQEVSLVSVDQAPVLEKHMAPPFPRKKPEEYREVLINALIDADGMVIDAQVEKDDEFRSGPIAANTVKQWTFEPATYQGVRVKVWISIPIRTGGAWVKPTIAVVRGAPAGTATPSPSAPPPAPQKKGAEGVEEAN
ncbi:MAG: protein kinase [Acidobacteriota bacterium]